MRTFRESLVLRAVVGLVAGGMAGAALAVAGYGGLAPMGGWVGFSVVFCLATWLTIGGMSAEDTKAHATREDPTRGWGDILLLLACAGSVVGVGLLLAGAQAKPGAIVQALLGVLGVFSSAAIVHTIYAVRYADLYYSSTAKKPVDFNEDDDPDYGDFAYLALTLGMTYQVSDTNIGCKTIRHTILRHCLISYVLGAVILACTINVVVQLASSSG